MESIPHATDPGDYGPGIIAGCVVVAVASTIAVCLRVLSRRTQGLSLASDDYLIFAALVGAFLRRPGRSTEAETISKALRMGHDHMFVPIVPSGTSRAQDLIQAFLASEILWAASIPIIKISILLLYIRIFGRLRYFKILAYVIGAFSICWGVMVIFVCALQCRPIQYNWDKSIQGTCINASLFFILGSAPNVFTDFVLLALPLPEIWNLHLTRAQKISLTGSLGIVSVWSTAEINLGILSACMPTMKPLLRRFLPQGESTRKAKGSQDTAKRYPSATASFGSSGVKKMKMGRARAEFSELDDDTSEYLPTATRTYISSGGGDNGSGDIPLNAIEVQTNMDWQHTVRESRQI
ncbi:MAG: hypothetical protein Q9219_004687 [cf. Caloplaca sp. 3 TL-2023]